MFVGVALADVFGAQLSVTQLDAEVFRRAGLHHVAQGHVAFPFLIVAVGGLDPETIPVHREEAQARYADLGEVIAVMHLAAALTGALELADHRLGHEVRRRAVALVQPHRIAVAGHCLVPGREGVAADQVGELRARELTVDLALGHPIPVVTEGVEIRVVAVGAVRPVVEVWNGRTLTTGFRQMVGL